jgi:hypothetical protein
LTEATDLVTPLSNFGLFPMATLATTELHVGMGFDAKNQPRKRQPSAPTPTIKPGMGSTRNHTMSLYEKHNL